MLTRKHYKAIAAIVSQTSNKAYQTTHTVNLLNGLADFFAQDDPLFDRDKFIAAAKK